ncbi:hypothetical protein DV737_g1219, partial [Chaetothyriales sp. CBS 132003]
MSEILKEVANLDRTEVVPPHEGDLILPADPLFTRLLTNAHRPKPRVVIRDVNTNVEKTAADLLSDVLNFRRVLKTALSKEVIEEIRRGREVIVSILAPGGYEFAVGILAVLALGAVASPFSPVMPVKEAAYYVNKARSVAVVVGSGSLKLGEDLEAEICSTTNSLFTAVPIQRYTEGVKVSPESIKISSNKYVDPNAAGFVIFTSGTTGPPKAVVLRRAAITDGALSFAQQIGLTEDDTSLHLLPVHHATGLWVGFFPWIQTGACLEFKSGSFNPEWTWNRFRRGGITLFSGVPTIWMRLMQYWHEHIVKLPSSEIEAYRTGINKIRVCMCGTSALPQPIDHFWAKLRNGRRIVLRYGCTETGVVFNMPFENNAHVPDGSVGEAMLGVDVKLSGGDEGEVLLKSSQMFSKYLYDPVATRKAHDEQGWYKTGDIARREGRYYFITGRDNVDILKSGGYKISALDIERELMSLPYIGEAMVVGVPDDEFGQRVAAVVTLRKDEAAQTFYREHNRDSTKVHIDDLRADARSRLAGYKLPTLLRIHQGEIPKSATGKVQKKILGPALFPPGKYADDPAVQIWTSRGRRYNSGSNHNSYSAAGNAGYTPIQPPGPNALSPEEQRAEREALDSITRWASDQIVEIFPHAQHSLSLGLAQTAANGGTGGSAADSISREMYLGRALRLHSDQRRKVKVWRRRKALTDVFPQYRSGQPIPPLPPQRDLPQTWTRRTILFGYASRQA